VKDGCVDIPQTPGLGVELDEDVVREMARHPHSWRNSAWRGPQGELREW
jgi:galactonate dehydratase